MGDMLLEQGFLLQKQDKEIKELKAKIEEAEMKLERLRENIGLLSRFAKNI